MGNSFEETIKETKLVVLSGTSAIHISGDDYSRIDEFVEKLGTALEYFDEEKKPQIVEWNYGYGQVDFKTRAKIGSLPEGEKTSFSKFLETYKAPRYADSKIILIRNARHVLEGEMNRENLAQLQQTIVHLGKKLPAKALLIYCDEKRFIPDELSSLVYYLDIKPPSQEEFGFIAEEFIKGKNFEHIDDNLIKSLSSMCVGMNTDSFRQILKKAALGKESFAGNLIPLAEKTKKQFVDKSGLLKFVNVEVDKNDVGGLDHLKWWLDQKKKAFEDQEGAKKKGINPAKGILLVGMPGCGKSLTSKAVANFFNLPLLSLDLGSLMGKYLGESEENLRRALRLAENSSPCVLWVDEIEKAFAGLGGDESGVSQRLFGYLLTWLNDKTARVFVMATANDVAVLPPEFLRRGRFDEIFYVDFPNAFERKEIFKIHLAKAFGGKEENGREQIDGLLENVDNKKNFEELIQKTDGYAGSDIEALVNVAIERAWKHNKDLKTDIIGILLSEREYMKPLKEVLAEKIERNKKKFGEYKLTLASEDKENMRRFETDSEGTEEEQIEIAKHERCPEHILLKLAKTGSLKVKLALLDNPNCPTTCIDEIIKNCEVIEMILHRPSINELLWIAMINQARIDKDTQTFLIEHPKCPVERKALLRGCACINCYWRLGFNPFVCNKYKNLGGDIFFWCSDWLLRVAPNENWCLSCIYNDLKKCTWTKSGMWQDRCGGCKNIKEAKRPKCSECKYFINGNSDKICELDGNSSNCPLEQWKRQFFR